MRRQEQLQMPDRESPEEYISDVGSFETQEEVTSWITWFTSIPGHEFFCEVPEEYIEDEFNLTGLPGMVKYYDKCIDTLLDVDQDDIDPEFEAKLHSQTARLYTLIHQRFILTRQGLAIMHDKYFAGEFGTCPRELCYGAHVLPCGTNDLPDQGTVKLYCPSCMDVYNPPSSRYNTVDGCAWGTTFPHLFMLTYLDIIHSKEPPETIQLIYEERIFGFKISKLSPAAPKMKWLRRYIRPEDYDDAINAEREREAAEELAQLEGNNPLDGEDEIEEEEDEEEMTVIPETEADSRTFNPPSGKINGNDK